IFAVEALPGQYDQAADSAAESIRLINDGIKPLVQTAKIYVLYGDISEQQLGRIKRYLINSVENRECSLEPKDSLARQYDEPQDIITLDGFKGLDDDALNNFLNTYSLALDIDDLRLTREYFRSIERDPTITEIRVLDTYWSDHCRHTTFLTEITDVDISDEILQQSFNRYLSLKQQLGRSDRPTTLMDIATAAMRYLKSIGKLDKLDQSKEVNACCVRTKVQVDGKPQDWLLYFKNETHNHPTEIEPFGGAATCVGGAIRDPMSGRSYVFQGMRITGAGDVRAAYEETLDGKLPQRYITTTAAAGNSSYSNAAGLTAGYLDEIYHPGYVAKRMELGALVGAVKETNVVRREPVEGDIVLLLGDKTGRDGIGGATGSSRTQTSEAFEVNSAEVQKGDAVIGRKIMRLFRNPELSQLIIRCNDFGAGGVSVAIGELADGLSIDLDKVIPKYPGLDGTELAISESQERMAVVIAAESFDRFRYLADQENLDVNIVAKVTDEPKMVIYWRGQKIVDLDREFLNLNGAPKHISVVTGDYRYVEDSVSNKSFNDRFRELSSSLSYASRRSIAARFGSTINAATLFLPFGGKNQTSPSQSMAARFPITEGVTSTASVLAYGYNPYLMSVNPYMGGYLAVNESISRLVAAGAQGDEMYLSFQEFFESLAGDPSRWGKPFAALLGALDAQLDYEIASVGGKDSMSGSYEGIDVPPTLVSFAVSITDQSNLVTPEFKQPMHRVILTIPEYDPQKALPTRESQVAVWQEISKLIHNGKAVAVYALGYGGIADAILKMTSGNMIGFKFDDALNESTIFSPQYGGFIVELVDDECEGVLLGTTSREYTLSYRENTIELFDLNRLNDAVLSDVFPYGYTEDEPLMSSVKTLAEQSKQPKSDIIPRITLSGVKPKALIPVFPGTNGEYDLASAASRAGIETSFFVMRNLTPKAIEQSFVKFSEMLGQSNMLLIPSGMSLGAEPDGAAKYISLFLNNARVRESVELLLEKNHGLILGIGEGFKALINVGLLPYGTYLNDKEQKIAITKNKGGFYVDRMVDVKVVSSRSIWLSEYLPGDIDKVPFSTAEGQIITDHAYIEQLLNNDQIATVYCDDTGSPAADCYANPAGSFGAIESLFSPDGRIYGRICNSERNVKGLYLNLPGRSDKSIFDGAFNYFK
ncbi:MAG: phosphoribosylformylglycinamidine synthase, partial [Oscillospiraceae bacterium]|nr:phosphoribosylformylglycinamidine synthase [Oscillospiraceae bacterium]